MPARILEGPLSPPPGRPSWGGGKNLPLLYLGWGKRDFMRYPLAVHYDRGADYHVIMRGEIVITAGGAEHIVRGPAALIFRPNFAFGIIQKKHQITEILAWIWQGDPRLTELHPPQDSFLLLDLKHRPLDTLIDLHVQCRTEVSRADQYLPKSLSALRDLIEVELLRASRVTTPTNDMRWQLATSWMKNNMAINAPVPALCDYLGMSASTLHRFFRTRINQSPGAYFRDLKVKEALRLIRAEGWQVKAVAYHLGYRHPNDLSRALASRSKIHLPRP